MSETPNPAISLPRRCPVCGSWKVRPHRLERLQPEELGPDAEHYACDAGHVFLAVDPLLTRSHDLISRAHLIIAYSRRLVGKAHDLIAEARRNRIIIRH